MIEILERWTDEESEIDCCRFRFTNGSITNTGVIVTPLQSGHGYSVLHNIPLSMQITNEQVIPFGGRNKVELASAIKESIRRGWFIKLKD